MAIEGTTGYEEPTPSLTLSFREDGWGYRMDFFYPYGLGMSVSKDTSTSPPGEARAIVAPKTLQTSLTSLDESDTRFRLVDVDLKIAVGWRDPVPYFNGEKYFDRCFSEYVSESLTAMKCDMDPAGDPVQDGYDEASEAALDGYIRALESDPDFVFVEPDGYGGCKFMHDFSTGTWSIIDDQTSPYSCELL
jgi:hypothetical protein